MDFDREYNKTRRPADLDDFTDSNVQALVEGRRTKALPRPRILVASDPYTAALAMQESREAYRRCMQRAERRD